jgi:lipoate-protein ligase A
MNWHFFNTGFNIGKYNMDFDLNLINNFGAGEAVLRLYRWKPYCISLGANQDISSIDFKKTSADNIDVVKRPTGGRAILHAEELTYSVVYPLNNNVSPKQIYFEINLAIKDGLKNYNHLFTEIEPEHIQPDFPSFYKEMKSTLCFAVSAQNELNFKGKKVVGSAQRKIGNVILQHGSILCGKFHRRVVEYLNLPQPESEEIKNEIEKTTTELESILDEKINYEELSEAVKSGFEEHFKIKFEEQVAEMSL